PMHTSQILLIHSLVVGILLLFWLYWLNRRGLFRWNTAGFWAWAAFLLYFVLNPLLSALSGDYLLYEINLTIAGREARATWIGVVICVGISVFYLVYLRTKAAPVTWKLKHPVRYPPTVWFVVLISLAVALPALLTFRVGFVGNQQNVVIEQGRFVGEVTGYEYSAHTFLLVPAVFLILAAPGLGRLAGWAILALYVIAGFSDPWARFLAVSSLIAVSLIDVLLRSKRWPRVIFVAFVIFVTSVLWIRGHDTFESVEELLATAAQAPASILDTLSSGDAAMLATFYLESYTHDTLAGFDYGIPLINYALTGLLPYRLFPNKYFLVDQLRSRQYYRIGSEIHALLYGAKSSLVGSFYAEGGIIAVVLMMAVAGWLSRKLDGMLLSTSPPLVRATGIVWMSILWMVWGSADYWALTTLGMVSLPTIGMWLFSPKTWGKRASGVRALTPQTHVGSFRNTPQSLYRTTSSQEKLR
ncbi:MAG: hypothetical protein QXS54_08780, partial [Candidatus Methanomethylicaceae archaeon]